MFNTNVMKRISFIRLVLLTFVTVCSLAFYQNGSLQQASEDHFTNEETITTTKKSGRGDFIIWESITRYFIAGYH
jgi:hypothetical protein